VSSRAPGHERPVALTALSLRRASEEAYEQLRSKILSGDLPPGTRLVEAKYARELAISQGTLREALARLAHEGLVLSLPRRGTYVASLSADAVMHLYELRERIEPFALRLAMNALGPADIDYLEHQLARIASRRVSDRVDADMAFHARIYELSGFAPLQGLWPTMESLTRKFLHTSRSFLSTETLLRTHRSILDALAKRDEAMIEEAAREHMRHTALLLAGATEPEHPRGTGEESTRPARGSRRGRAGSGRAGSEPPAEERPRSLRASRP
jgi:DNA-binding GntR family transcriptional regulator